MDAFYIAFVLKKDLEAMLDMEIDVVMFTDQKQLLDSVTWGKRTSERRLSIEFTAARQSYKNVGIACIGLVSGDANPEDGLTKVDGNGKLRLMMETGRDCTPVEQWIERKVQRVDENGAGQSTGLDDGVAVLRLQRLTKVGTE